MLPLDGKQGDIVALLYVAHKAVHLVLHCVHQLAGCFINPLNGYLLYTMTAKETVCFIPGLVEPIGIEKQHVTRLELCLLALIAPVRQGTYWQIGFNRQWATTDKRCLVSGITIIQNTRVEVEDPNKHGNKIASRVFITEVVIHGLNDADSRFCTTCLTAEHSTHHGHYESCRHPLTTDVADAEKQAIATQEIVIEVTAHLTGWCL